jgi:hypothetical protein
MVINQPYFNKRTTIPPLIKKSLEREQSILPLIEKSLEREKSILPLIEKLPTIF